MFLRTLLAVTFALPAVSIAAEGGFTSCHTVGSMEGSGAGSSCAVVSRRAKARRKANTEAQLAVKARMDLIDWLWVPYCQDFCESIDLDYRGYSTCGIISSDMTESEGNACSFPSIGRRRHASVEAEVATGCRCWGLEQY